MDVTKENFPSVLQSIGPQIKRSAFIAIDAEMTGISDTESQEKFDDPPSMSFKKKTEIAQKYGLIQVGVCLFEAMEHSDKEADYDAKTSYHVRPYNFYVFPSSIGDLAHCSKRFMFEPGAIIFNKQHNMNFQRWIYDGVGYCNAGHEAEYKAHRMKQHGSEAESCDEFDENFMNYVGFRKVFQLMSESKKPIVGHNVLMDILFLIEAMDQTVKFSPQAFRAYMHNKFPFIYDTKVLSSSSTDIANRFSRISLQSLFEYYMDNPAYGANRPSVGVNETTSSALMAHGINLPYAFSKYTQIFSSKRELKPLNASFAHEAAYDALCTGIVFLNLCRELPATAVSQRRNHLALYKNFHILNLNSEEALFQWMPEGRVYKIMHNGISQRDIAESVVALRGRVAWVDEGAVAIVVDKAHSARTVSDHFRSLHASFRVQEITRCDCQATNVHDLYTKNREISNKRTKACRENENVTSPMHRFPLIGKTLPAIAKSAQKVFTSFFASSCNALVRRIMRAIT